MDFVAVLDQVITLLRQRGRLTYRTLKRQFELDDVELEDLKEELIYGQHLAVDEDERVLVWIGDTAATTPPASGRALVHDTSQVRAPLAYTPPYLAEKILTSRSALEGERKQVTVLFADLKGSMELLADRDPEEARQLLDPVLERMMAAVHRYEGTVNQVMGDGIMALFGAPLAHEDHAVRACYAALAMQAAVQHYAAEVQRTHGVPIQMRVGLNAGEVVVRAIGNDLHMDYSAIGQTTHLAARMEQMAMPGSCLVTPAVLGLAEGYVHVRSLGPVPVKGLDAPVEVFELVGASGIRRRLQAAAVRGLTRFVGRDTEMAALGQALEHAGAGPGQVVALVGEAGVGKSRLVYECVHSPRTQGWRVLESASVSYGKATPYFPIIDLLKHYVHVDDADEPRTIRAKVTGQVLTLDETLQETIPALLWLLDALPDDSPFRTLDPPQRRQRLLDALKRVLLRESQVQPLLLVFEDLHWIDTETQALLDRLVDSLPTASGDIVLHAQANHYLGIAYQAQGDYRRAIGSLEQTVAFYDGARRYERFGMVILPAVISRVWLAWCHADLGTFAEGRAIGDEGLQIAEAVAHPLSLMHALRGLGLLSLHQGDLPRAFPLLERAVGLCQDADLPIFFPWMATALGAAYTLGGRVTDAVPLLTQAMEQSTVMEMVVTQALCRLSLGEAHLLAGCLKEAHMFAEQALELTRVRQERGHQAYTLRLLGEIAARREPPQVELAAAHYQKAFALAEELGMRPLQAHCHRGLGTLYATTGQREQARIALSTALVLYRDMGITFWLPQTEAALAQVET